MKTEPPFDDSAPCPACQIQVRSVYAEMANLCRSWPANGSARRVQALRRTEAHWAKIEVEDPAVRAMMWLVTPIQLSTTYAEIALLMPAIRKVVDDVGPLMEAHFADASHALRA